MAYRIDYRFPHRRLGKFKPRRRRRAVCRIVRADLIADVRHDTEGRVVNHLEDVAGVYLMVGHRFFHTISQKPRALDT